MLVTGSRPTTVADHLEATLICRRLTLQTEAPLAARMPVQDPEVTVLQLGLLNHRDRLRAESHER